MLPEPKRRTACNPATSSHHGMYVHLGVALSDRCEGPQPAGGAAPGPLRFACGGGHTKPPESGKQQPAEVGVLGRNCCSECGGSGI